MKNLLANWKTTSAGILMIAGATVHLVFTIKSHSADESAWMVAITGILGGVGLILAGDASNSQQKQNAGTPPDSNNTKS